MGLEDNTQNIMHIVFTSAMNSMRLKDYQSSCKKDYPYHIVSSSRLKHIEEHY